MSTAISAHTSVFGHQLKQWRRQRGLSQLELAARAETTQRHISFIETGRSRPGVQLVHKVAEALDIPLRERNTMLTAAGLVPSYPTLGFADAAITPFRDAIRHMLRTHEPYPAYVINRWWDLVDANAAGYRLFGHMSDGVVNAVDLILGPGPLRAAIENYPAVAWAFMRRLRREVAGSGPDARLTQLLERAEHYMKSVPAHDEDLGPDLVVCPRLKVGDQIIKNMYGK